MVIRIRKKSQAEWLTIFISMMPFAFFLLMDILHFPSMVKYTLDIAWVWLLLLLVVNRFSFPNIYTKKLAKLSGVFFSATLIGFVLGLQSPLYYLWGLRNNARFFVFFFACIFFLREDGIEQHLRLLDVLFFINVPVALFQYFVLGKEQDLLGGIFGMEKGCNAYVNIFLMITMAKAVLLYMNHKVNLLDCLIKCGLSLMIAALTELKFLIIEFIVIIAMASLLTKFSFRKLAIIAIAGFGVVIAAQVIAHLFPEFANWFTIENMLDGASSNAGYTMSGDMNRFTTIPISWNRFLKTWPQKLFGLGLGNCDYSVFSILTSPFYRAYGSLHYMWFSSSFLLLETGLVGLVLYIAFFLMVYRGAHELEKKGQKDPLLCQLAKIMAVMCLMLVVYDGSLRTEAAYMMFFILALPFIRHSKQKETYKTTNISATYVQTAGGVTTK